MVRSRALRWNPQHRWRRSLAESPFSLSGAGAGKRPCSSPKSFDPRELLTDEGKSETVDRDYMQFGYDTSTLHKQRDIALAVTFQLDPVIRRQCTASCRKTSAGGEESIPGWSTTQAQVRSSRKSKEWERDA